MILSFTEHLNLIHSLMGEMYAIHVFACHSIVNMFSTHVIVLFAGNVIKGLQKGGLQANVC